MKKEKLLKMRVFGFIALFVLGVLAGCSELLDSEKDVDVENKGKGTVVIKLTDAPFPVDLVAEANITVDWVKLMKHENEEGEGNGNGNNEEGDDDGNNAFVTYELEENVTFNLLDLSNGVTATLAEMEVPAGVYHEIRLHIVDAGIVLNDGTEFDLKVPSGDASGLKIKVNPALEMNGESFAEVLLDFDVSRSFVLRGNMKHGYDKVKGFIFKPVVRAVANFQVSSGEISGMVTDSAEAVIENALLTLIEGGDTVTSAMTSENGTYAMIGIPPGDYSLALNADDYENQVSVTVEAGAVTVQNFVIPVGDEVPEAGEISGTVSDTAGVVIQNAMLTLFAGEDSITSANTSEQGLYSFAGINPGDYNLVCKMEGFVSQDSTLTVMAGEVTEQNFALVPVPEDED
ncbi:DUF4382 domain-containing protein [Mariniphaga sediminis]|uniref:DUF4382 domain-containing protein n=1 Tax=Mariniphaga sediminis TaxID=1628158 RepID=A0A399D591_9BACT|nr:DUF4382 domain-containing protein [Mariniphaga sediminis]RIH65832.1 DUF4382 domain-containing protein [Mariniphaga sediminis]